MDKARIIEVDARNLLCPMPVIRTQRAVEPLARGTQVTITSTDPGAMNDIPAWARIHGHKVLDMEEHNGEYTVILEVQGQ